MSWPLFFICKLKTKLFLHMQCPILFGVDFGKQQISSNDIRSSYFCVPLREIYSINIFRLFLQRKGKKVMFFSVQTDTVWLKLSSVSKVAAHSIGAQLVGHFTSSSHLNLKKITFVGSLDCPIGVWIIMWSSGQAPADLSQVCENLRSTKALHCICLHEFTKSRSEVSAFSSEVPASSLFILQSLSAGLSCIKTAWCAKRSHFHFCFKHFLFLSIDFSPFISCPFNSTTCSFTGKHLRLFTAGVTLNKAAPLELAVALPHACVLMGVVAPAAAHQVAAVRVRRCVVTQPPSRSRASRCSILLAIVGWALQVNQVSVGGLYVPTGLLETQERRLPKTCGSHGLHLDRSGKTLLKDVADLSEFRQSRPTGFCCTWARDAMTFTFQLHPFL